MKNNLYLLFTILILVTSSPVHAHFGALLPEADIVDDPNNNSIRITAAFIHPFLMEGMDLVAPEKVGVIVLGVDKDLTRGLRPTTFLKHKAWEFSYTMKRPGDHIFYMIPQPFWEEAEGKYIQHITKVIVNAFGLESGWEKASGLKAEIVPFTRPYGLWTGNTFCGKALFKGAPLAHARVEVEYLNQDRPRLKAPKAAFQTQVVVTDNSGRFCCSMPRAGWWGFSAIKVIKDAMMHHGQKVPLEVGAVLWIKTEDMGD